MGLLRPADWKASWIEPALDEDVSTSGPAPMLRGRFTIKEKIKEARAYVTSHGLYELHLNGQRVGDQLFTPGWTSYNKRLQYQIPAVVLDVDARSGNSESEKYAVYSAVIRDLDSRETVDLLVRKLDVPIKYILVDNQDLKELFPKDGDRWWTRFYTKYRYSSGIIDFSNVGFSHEMDQVFLYTGRICGGLCGAGYFLLLTRDRCGWKVQDRINVWVS
jgi:Alpha-L-rhamnosidase N-terminal domain